jgi:tRNA nucleotidyltransferase (CCA-adding enzyme)
MERKVLPGYKGFVFDSTPDVSLEADLIRRDLTINAMAEDENGQLFDFYHGKQDLQQKVLRHVSPAFKEDPVRILRVGRLLARYYYLGFHVADETMALMKTMVDAGEVDALVAERVWKEFDRALAEKNPEKFFEVLANCGALAKLFPGLDLNGPCIKALHTAAQLSTDTVVRFAALMTLYSQDDHVAIHNVKHICDRYRAPNEYRELAKLTIKHYPTAHTAKNLSAAQLVQLLSTLDIFRREHRFHQFLLVCDAIAQTMNIPFDQAFLKQCADVAKSFDVRELISAGLKGEALAIKLREKRVEKIAAWLNKS